MTEGNPTSWVPPGPTASPRGSLGQPALPDLECSLCWLASPNIKVLSLDLMAEQSLKDEKLEVLGLPPLPEALGPGPLIFGKWLGGAHYPHLLPITWQCCNLSFGSF